ncbi:hypothetical protein BDV40DRAFT_255557 [Aspergillus tamarii]|uniref:Uncharacterized protein n=1 Tax=Aspergillus tamarii TaxID=41984 RepID=A0A5N6V5W8_ASPTM|nr:hypothetical protein BDV40DRAFT_255557 [Aspergillus tamarii]
MARAAASGGWDYFSGSLIYLASCPFFSFGRWSWCATYARENIVGLGFRISGIKPRMKSEEGFEKPYWKRLPS